MLALEVEHRVKGEYEQIWGIITDSNCLSQMVSDITRVEQRAGDAVGMVRVIHHNSGRSWEEVCMEWEAQSHFTMQIKTEQYPLPVKALRRITSMQQRKNSIIIKIRYEYTPSYGPFGVFMDKYQIRPILTIFATQLLDNLAKTIHQQGTDALITAATILQNKNQIVLTIIPETLIADACQIMTDKRIGCLIVLDRQGKIAGVLSERNIVNSIAIAGQTILNEPVKKFMSQHVTVSDPEHGLATLMAMMSESRLHYLPVVDDDENLVGVISIGDIVNARMSELEQESAAMHQYIEGRKWREVAMQIGRGAAADEFS